VPAKGREDRVEVVRCKDFRATLGVAYTDEVEELVRRMIEDRGKAGI